MRQEDEELLQEKTGGTRPESYEWNLANMSQEPKPASRRVATDAASSTAALQTGEDACLQLYAQIDSTRRLAIWIPSQDYDTQNYYRLLEYPCSTGIRPHLGPRDIRSDHNGSLVKPVVLSLPSKFIQAAYLEFGDDGEEEGENQSYVVLKFRDKDRAKEWQKYLILFDHSEDRDQEKVEMAVLGETVGDS